MSSEESEFEKWWDYAISQKEIIKLKEKDFTELAFEAGRAAKVVKWPSEEEIIYRAKHEDSDSYFGFLSACEWIKSQVKPIEIPSFTNEEINHFNIKYHKEMSDAEYDCTTKEKSFDSGFKLAIELMKRKLGE